MTSPPPPPPRDPDLPPDPATDPTLVDPVADPTLRLARPPKTRLRAQINSYELVGAVVAVD